MACGGGCCSAASGAKPESPEQSQVVSTRQDEQDSSQVDKTTQDMGTRSRSSIDSENMACDSDTKPEDGDCCDMPAGQGCCAASSPPMPSENGQNVSSKNCDEVPNIRTGPPKVTCADGCCSAAPETPSLSCASEEDLCGGGCCEAGEKKAKPNTNILTTECNSISYVPKGGQTSCCDNDGKCSQVRETIQAIQVEGSSTTSKDIEKGIVGLTHVVLSITGMTCTGCETKLRRTLATLPDIKNLKTSLVLARTEFDIQEHSATTVDDVIDHLHRTTEFKCEHISNRGASLDFICLGNPATFVNSDWPEGVLDVKKTGKQAIRAEYDAHLIGARDLLHTDWAKGLDLAPPNPDAGLAAGTRHVRHMGFMTLLSAALTIPVLVMAWAPLPEKEIAYGSASLALATLVQVMIAGPFYPKAIKALVFSRVIEMDLLIVLSTSAAYIFSVVSFGYLVAGRPLATGEFFETSTLLVTLIMVGRFVAALARQKAAESVSIRSLQTAVTTIIRDDGTDMEIDVRLLQFGDKFKIAPDARVPTDGTVLSGSSEVDESMLTGETIPIEKQPGSAVIAGSINGSGMLVVRLTRLPSDNTITTIACMVDEAKLSKPRIQETADRVASYFVPVVVALAVITFVIWVAVGMTIRNQSGSRATIEAITYAITVLIVSCPCAIGLAVPMVIVVASGIAARRGVIFKTSASMEVAYKTTHVVFDKTGTLTMGELAVVEELYLSEDVEMVKSLLLGVVTSIKHPVSAAVSAYLLSNGVVAINVDNPTVVPGKGVQATFKGRVLRAGNSKWLDTSSHHSVQSVLSSDLTVFCFMIDDSIVAVFGLQDKLRADAQSTLSSLAAEGISIHLLSGDDEGAVRKVASQLHIPPQNIRSQCSPADKQAYVSDLQSAPLGSAEQPQAIVMFVGDGTNDAVALAQATIGVHMSSGTDIAQSAADIVLARPNLVGVMSIIRVSKKAMQRVWFNFGWSFFYNTFAVLLAAGAFVHARIPPEYAGLGELVSVLPVILAAVLLRWEKI